MYQKPSFVTGSYYHLYNRGVAKQPLFHDAQDYRHFLLTLGYYLEDAPAKRLSEVAPVIKAQLLTSEPDTPLVEIVAYCLMPNHFHILVRQLVDDGITTFMRRALNSYTRSFNTRYDDRVGTIYQGRFSAVAVITDEQLLHLSRYIHLNPVVAGLSNTVEAYAWSSYRTYIGIEAPNRLAHPAIVLGMIGNEADRYRTFVEDQISYAQELELVKHLSLEQ